jgi:site-specific recombinase XerD
VRPDHECGDASASWAFGHEVRCCQSSYLGAIGSPTRGRRWSISAARAQLRETAASAGVGRRFAPYQLRHAHAVELAHEGVPLVVIQRQLGHSNLGITSVYLQGIDNAEITEAVQARRAPMVPVRAALER